MRILLITPMCPYPPEKSGGVHTVYNLIRANTQHEIDLFYYGDEEPDCAEELRSQDLFNKIAYIPVKRRQGVFGRLMSVAIGIPYAQYQFNMASFPEISGYDLVVYDQFPSESLVSRGVSCRQLCFVHDSMPRYFKRKATMAGNLFASLYYRLQFVYARISEAKALKVADGLVFVSEDDAAYSSELYSEIRKCRAITLGVDSPHGVVAKFLGKSIVFSGVMDYAPNEDAALFFLKEIFPAVAERHPDVTLYLVGKNPTKRLYEACLGNENVVLTGFVDSVAAYILGATIYVSPLRYGTGVKNKVLEAMSCGAPLIASSISIEGIPECRPGVNCLVADSPEEWVEATCRLLGDEAERNRLKGGLATSFDTCRSWGKALDTLVAM